MQLICPRCFKTREEAKRQPLNDIKVCGGCAMDIDAVLGFLSFSGYGLQLAMFDADANVLVNTATGEVAGTPADPEATPPLPPKRPRKPRKAPEAAVPEPTPEEEAAEG